MSKFCMNDVSLSVFFYKITVFQLISYEHFLSATSLDPDQA